MSCFKVTFDNSFVAYVKPAGDVQDEVDALRVAKVKLEIAYAKSQVVERLEVLPEGESFCNEDPVEPVVEPVVEPPVPPAE